ncbi:Brix domain-domain-containing protein [Protomyces lactucae-debilis]|uniref:Ribosome production factor 2 homolog n=1 Tax=Protomyces lactucae-debilis TaxID=2754530 RepID=A0A1Y2FEV2_PROLT|nr:Brix domain-containing protein [Protomyces lactucae-debilis]ORY81934.1 Brix domain-domain-containing protein [Protomyces lactucae-debilis]
MLKAAKPKTARTKRVMDDRAPKLTENAKQAIFVRSQTANAITQSVLQDLMALKKPDAQSFSKKDNKILPFEDASSLEFFAEKNDASLFVVGTHSKKRPNNLVCARMFDGSVLDMIEVGVENPKFMHEFKGSKTNVGIRPLMLFSGPLFESHPSFRQLKSFLLDLYRGREISSMDAVALQHIMVLTHADSSDSSILPPVQLRVYLIKAHKSGQKLPRVELEEMGPSFDLRMRRLQLPDEGMLKLAMKRPTKQVAKTKKNIQTDEMGDKVAQIHIGKQELDKMQTRKFKGLKRSRDTEEDEQEGSDDFEGDDIVSEDDDSEEEEAVAGGPKRLRQ